jgi:mRNA interferase YafQ
MIELKSKNRYNKELRSMLKRGKDYKKIQVVVEILFERVNQNKEYYKLLPEKYRLHKLTNGLWECHIEPDWLLVFDLDDHALTLERTGAHSDIFNKVRR